MSNPKLTEERLRYYLDTNQVMRERLCLAILPLMGSYTHERPRRPKGGPDGGRDIEAIFQGKMEIWGAVGFRNGGGNSLEARHDTEDKFHSDLDRALSENPALQGFVFFTNVDLTPTIIKSLKEAASARGVSTVDIFDIERLRHALDSPEGLIARLQYLDIPMSATEQIALVSKFGNQLQNAVLARFDRVERTLSQMERFLDYQKPLHRLDIFVALKDKSSSSKIGNEAILLDITGLQSRNHKTFCLCINQAEHKFSSNRLVMRTYLWLEQQKKEIISFIPCIGLTESMMSSYCELILTTGGHRVRIADLTTIIIEAHFTSRIIDLVDKITIDVNGYEILNCPISIGSEEPKFEIPIEVPYDAKEKIWVKGLHQSRNFMFDPPYPSGRLSQIHHV